MQYHPQPEEDRGGGRVRQFGRFLVVLLLSLPALASAHAAPLALDISDASPIQTLEGPWTVYWGEFVAPEAFATETQPPPTGDMRLPGGWNQLKQNERPLPATGHATYHLRLDPQGEPGQLMLRIPMIYSAYHLYVNGEFQGGVGQPGAAPAYAAADYGEHLVWIPPPSEQIELVLHVSNYSSRVGGIPRTPRIGLPDAIIQEQSVEIMSNSALAGGLTLIGLFQLALFLLRRGERAYLYFGLTATIWGVHTLISGQLLSLAGWHVPVEMARTLDGLTALLGGVMYLWFASSLFPRHLPMRYTRWAALLPLLYLPVMVLAPELTRSQVIGWLLYLIVASLALALVAILRAWWQRHPDAGLFLVAAAAVVVTAAIQIYWFNEGGVRAAIVGLGLLFATGLYSVILARRYGRAFSRSRDLARALRRANRLKDEFLADTSHELRTPLHAMVGVAETLPRHGDSRLEHGLEIITESGQRLARLLDQVLDITRLRHDDLPHKPRPVAIAPVVNAVLDTCAPLIGARKVTLQPELEVGLPPVHADPDLLHQALFNLVTHAIRHTDQGTIIVSARMEASRVRMEIADTGIGTSGEEWEQTQKPHEESHEYGRGDLGLGLAITRRILALHESEMDVDSLPGRGTVVRFWLNTARDTKETDELGEIESNTRPSSARPDTRTPGQKILVVDNNDNAAAVLMQQLATAGYQPIHATNGEDALAQVKHEKPALVLLDMMIPDMGALSLCRRLRETYDATSLPVVLVTARTRQEEIIEGLNAGANDYLAKPFYRKEMLARVEPQLRVHENQKMRLELEKLEDNNHDPHTLLVELLRRTVHHWELETGRSRAELANESGLWAVTLDGSTLRARTLDRYLSSRTLPRRPRWGLVTRTARFVMEYLESPEAIAELEQLLDELETALTS